MIQFVQVSGIFTFKLLVFQNSYISVTDKSAGKILITNKVGGTIFIF